MDYQKLIDEANARSAKLYLHRQQLQMQAQQIQMQSTQVEMDMLKLDGEIDSLKNLLVMESQKKEENNG